MRLTLLALASIPLAIIYTAYAIGNRSGAPRAEEHIPPPLVSVIESGAHIYPAQIDLYGEVRATDELDLVVEVDGRIDALAAAFKSGNRVAKGELLFSVNATGYKAALASARQRLQEARLKLLEEERQARLARKDWKRSGLGNTPDSPLVLRSFQVKAARAQVEAAEADLAQAQRDLGNTRVHAPFDAVVVQRNVSPGSYVTAGTVIAKLYSSAQVEIRLALTAEQWRLLPAPGDGHKVTLFSSSEDRRQWRGHIVRRANFIDNKTRLRELTVAVDDPLELQPPLLPGSFVSARLTGKPIGDLLKVPESALSADGYVWYVTQDKRLARFAATPLFAYSGALFLQAPPITKHLRIVRHPLARYQPGMQVEMRIGEARL